MKMQDRMESLLFDYQTTYRTDFRRGNVSLPTFTLYKAKPTCLRPRPPPLKDLHTLSAWEKAPVPFSLMHRPKPITRTDPNKVQETFLKPVDTQKEHVIKTRPRLTMTPAVALDDMEDLQARNRLCEDMYTTIQAKASKEAVSEYFSVKSPLPGKPAPASPIKLPALTFPFVSPEWRMETVTWDKKQLRSYCDPTKEFWLKQEVPPCRSCKEFEIVYADRKRRFQMRPARIGNPGW